MYLEFITCSYKTMLETMAEDYLTVNLLKVGALFICLFIIMICPSKEHMLGPQVTLYSIMYLNTNALKQEKILRQ